MRVALICRTVAHAAGAEGPGGRPLEIEDFLPGGAEPREQTPEEIRAIFDFASPTT